MNSSVTPLCASAAKDGFREALASGMDRDEVIHRMRVSGYNKIASIKLLRDLTGISLGDAKVAVHSSPAWADCRQSDDALHEAAFAAAKELGFVEAVGTKDEAGSYPGSHQG